MTIDLTKLSRKDLLKLQKDAAAAMQKADAQARKEARAAAEKAVAEFGYTLDEVIGTTAPRKKSIGAAKYRNPNDPSQTWTGRGRKPRWLTDAIAAGVDITDLEI